MTGHVSILIFIIFFAQVSSGKDAGHHLKEMFGSRSLKCLVCQRMVEEFNYAIMKTDKVKKIVSGSFRIEADGNRKEKIVPYLRSEQHITHLLETICKQFESYAQAQDKATLEPTIIRITTHNGEMNPEFGLVNIVPDEDLNTRLKFYCETIVEEEEDAIHDLLKRGTEDFVKELCHIRSNLCHHSEKIEL